MKQKQPLRIIVSGLAASVPVGGMAWHYMQYVVGLSRMGHDVYYHEDTWSWPFNPKKNAADPEGHYSAQFLAHFFDTYAPDLKDRWHYLHLRKESFGMPGSRFDDISRTADIFLNVSGANFFPKLLSPQCLKVFVDTDPGYNQILLLERFDWSEFVDRWCRQFAAHDAHVTFAERIGHQDCRVPDVGVRWLTTRMPIVLDCWQSAPDVSGGPHWSSIMTWNVFKGRLEHKGIEYGDKAVEFERIIELPAQIGAPLRLALGGTGAPHERLADAGWDVVSAPDVTRTPGSYRDFIRESLGEVSIVKQVYAALRTGWFSERSACYLASGRPVILQDTGFSEIFPVGKGLFAFTNLEEAVDAVRRVEMDYDTHSRGALEIAHTYFDHDRVLRRLLGDLGA